MVRLALGLWLALTAPQEEPAPPSIPIELRWSAPDECPDREAFLEAMTAIAGRRLVPSPGAELAVDGRIERSSRGYALELRLVGPAGEELRTLEAPECGALASAGSLVVVTRLLGVVPPAPEDRPGSAEEAGDGEAAVEVPPPPPAVEVLPEPFVVDDSPAPPEDDPRVEPQPAARPVSQAVLVALGGVAAGLGPRPTGIVRASVGLRRGSIRVEAFAMHVFATTTGGGTAPGVRVSLSGGGALGCWAPALGRLEVPLCGGVALGAAVGRGVGPLATSRDVQQLWVGLPLEAGVAWAPTPRLALRALVGGDIGLRRPGFHVEVGGDRAVIERAWPVGLHAVGGLELRLP